MAFLRSTAGRVLAGALLSCLAVVGLTALRIRAAVMPPRPPATQLDFAAMGLEIREMRFPAVDGVELRGWRLPGDARRPPVVLCHDWGATKESLLHLAIRLHDEGFPLLLFDFRGHGDSAGRGSTLGAAEKRDVLGAIDFARTMGGGEQSRIGVYGLGMGAHAAVLAARERKLVRVLVLDGLYPDPQFELLRRFYHGWGESLPRAEFLPVGVFAAMNGSVRDEGGADGVLGSLTGRDLLFLAPAGDEALSREIERMYHLVPLQPDVDGNLVRVPAASAGGTYGEALERHDRDVAAFFSSRLLRPSTPAGPAG